MSATSGLISLFISKSATIDFSLAISCLLMRITWSQNHSLPSFHAQYIFWQPRHCLSALKTDPFRRRLCIPSKIHSDTRTKIFVFLRLITGNQMITIDFHNFKPLSKMHLNFQYQPQSDTTAVNRNRNKSCAMLSGHASSQELSLLGNVWWLNYSRYFHVLKYCARILYEFSGIEKGRKKGENLKVVST